MLFFWILASAFRAQPGRWLIAGLTVALGIALAVGIHTVNRSALGEFGRAMDLVNGQASTQLVMASGDFSDQLFDDIVSRQHELGIQAVSPVLERRASSLRILGLDIFQAAQVTPSLMPAVEGQDRQQLFADNVIFLSSAALTDLSVAVGDPLTLSFGGKTQTFRVAGLVPGATGQQIAVMDLGVAQWRLDGLGRLSRLDIQLVQGKSLQALAADLERLNLGLTLVTAEDRDRRMSNLSRAYRVNLNVLALVALFTGAFLVFTTISFSVLRQQSQLALLNILGASQVWLFAVVITQALLVAALGGLLGIGMGLGLASLLLQWVGGDLGGGYFSASIPPLEIDWAILLGFWLLSLAVGALAGYFPARAATSDSPVAQLKSGAAERILKPVLDYRIALGLALVSLILAFLPAIDGLPIAAYLSIALLLLASLALTPSLVRQCFSLLSRLLLRRANLSSSFTLAVWRLSQAPASAAGLIAGVVAALALTVAMVVMVASFRDSVTRWLDQVLPADLYASLKSSTLSEDLARDPALASLIVSSPGVERVEWSLQQQILLRPDRPEVTLMARPISAGGVAQTLPLTGSLAMPPAGLDGSAHPERPEVYVSEAMTDLYGWKPGEVHSLPLAGVAHGRLPVWVAGVFRDYGRQHGSIVMDLSTYQRLTHDLRRTDMAIWIAPGKQPSEVLDLLQHQFPEMKKLPFRSASDLRALSLKIFDRSFALTYALEVAALLVAIFSVAAGFAGQALLRQKEFALMHHLGQSSQQQRQWIIEESGMLLALAACWGTLLGLLMSQVLIHRVNPQSFHWTMQTSMPVVALMVLSLVIVLSGIAAAVWASRKNLKSDQLVLSMREDW